MTTPQKEALRRRLSKQSIWSKPWFYLVLLFALILLALLVYQIPAVHERLSWRVDSAMARVYYFFNPPGQEVFVPIEDETEQLHAMQTLTA